MCLWQNTSSHGFPHSIYSPIFIAMQWFFLFLFEKSKAMSKSFRRSSFSPQPIIKLFKVIIICQKIVNLLLRALYANTRFWFLVALTHCCNNYYNPSIGFWICLKELRRLILCLSISRPQPRHSCIWLLIPMPHFKQGRGIWLPFLIINLCTLQ